MITNPIVLTNALKAKKRQEEEIMQMRILNTKYKNFVFFVIVLMTVLMLISLTDINSKCIASAEKQNGSGSLMEFCEETKNLPEGR